MSPKPFPFPLGVGIDICNVDRIAYNLRFKNKREAFVRKLFTRLEWPGIWRKFLITERAMKAHGRAAVSHYQEQDVESHSKIDAIDPQSMWNVPSLSSSPDLFTDSETRIGFFPDSRSSLGRLVSFVAGRWAAKEAAIKAHTHRDLRVREISIISPTLNQDRAAPGLKNRAPYALIDPPCDLIRMDEEVANIRSLRGFGSQAWLQKSARATFSGKDNSGATTQTYSTRRSKVKESERQIAQVSISHDFKYASAVCIAISEPGAGTTVKEMVDDGAGLPMHEPEWGDSGWLEEEPLVEDEEKTTPESGAPFLSI